MSAVFPIVSVFVVLKYWSGVVARCKRSSMDVAQVKQTALLSSPIHTAISNPAPILRKCPTDGDYVIMQFNAKNVTWSLSRMFDGSGSQSLHFITASIWL